MSKRRNAADLRSLDEADGDGNLGVADVDKGRAAGEAHDGVLLAVLGVGPAPHVVALRAEEINQIWAHVA